MTHSESIKEITSALIAFQDQVSRVMKTRTAEVPTRDGKKYTYIYANLSDIQDVIREPMQKNGLNIVQMPDGANGLTTLLSHISGEWMESRYEMPPTQSTPQAIGSNITYQRRYALAAALNICVDDDDDGQKGSSPAQKQSDIDREITENDILLAVKMCKTVDEINSVYKQKKSAFKNQNRLIEACSARKKELA